MGLFSAQDPLVDESSEVAARAVYALEQTGPNWICTGTEKAVNGACARKSQTGAGGLIAEDSLWKASIIRLLSELRPERIA